MVVKAASREFRFAGRYSLTGLLANQNNFALPETVKFASIGPITSKTMREAGLTVHAEAERHTIPGLVEAVLKLAEQRPLEVTL